MSSPRSPDDEIARFADLLEAHQSWRAAAASEGPPTLAPEDVENRILYDRDGVVVVDKPAGIPSTGHRLTDPDSVQNALIRRHDAMTWAVHQLDADTTGLNVFVRRKKLVPHWQNRMRYPNGTKLYLALVYGTVDPDAFVVDRPIGDLPGRAPRQLGVAPDGRPARTHCRVLDRDGGFSLLEARLETGRTHQIRIHLSSLGHPLVGEQWYRNPPCQATDRQALHAWRLEFGDSEQPRRLRSLVPEDLLRLIAERGLAWTEKRSS